MKQWIHTTVAILAAGSAAAFGAPADSDAKPQTTPPAPAEYSTDTTHLIVCRPLDSWSGDNGVMEAELDMVKSRRAHIRILLDEKGHREIGAGNTLLNGPSDDPLITAAMQAFKARDFEVTHRGRYYWALGVPQAFDPSTYDQLRAGQLAAFTLLIHRQGDPDAIPGSVTARKALGNFLALGGTLWGADKYGATGAYVMTTTFAGDLYQLPLPMRQRIAPCILPQLDAKSFKEMEVYPVKVNDGGSSGQVIVAYREAKTPEVTRTALVQAIVSIAGADTTPEAVERARAQDLAYRKSIWAQCVSAGQCGDAAKTATKPAEVSPASAASGVTGASTDQPTR
jgi:hypothetical protein